MHQKLVKGTVLPSLQVDKITRTQLALFAGASGDHQPTHLDIDAARAKGYDDVFAHGMLSMAFLGRLLTKSFPQESIRSFHARFLARVPLHSHPLCSGRVTDVESGLARLELLMTLEDGTAVVRGEALIDTLALPPDFAVHS